MNKRVGTSRRAAGQRWLCRAAAAALSTLALAALAVELPAALAPLAPAPAAAAGASAPGSLSADEWRTRLAQARGAHERLMALPADRQPLLTERQAASTRRLALLTTQMEAALEPPAESQRPGAAAAPPRLAGPGPYSVIEVDALRDQLDDLHAQGSALRTTLGSLEAEVRSAIETRNQANAAANLSRDKATRPLGNGDRDQTAAQTELAAMRAQIAGLEVLQADRMRQRTQARLAALEEPTAQLERELDRVRGQQRLDAATLALKLKELDAEERSVVAERTRLEDRIALRSQPDSGAADARLREMEALQGAVGALRELQALARRLATTWRGRHDLLAADNLPANRRAMSALAAAGIDQLAAERRSVGDRLDLLRIEMRSTAAESAARGDEQRLLEAQQLQLSTLQRLDESLRRASVMLTRVRDDIALDEPSAGAQGWLDRTRATLGDGLLALWQKELFSATETTVIDGQVVTVDHGVTVGKSIGLLVMLLVGYFAAGALSRLIAQQLERRLHVSPQFARVLRRWLSSILMIAVVLIVLRLARIPLTAFAFLGGALAIGVGFGTQNIIKNLISGVIILLERKIHVGDVVTVGGMSGTVVTVDFRATTVRGFDGVDSIVPNSQLLENQISNWSGGGPSVRRIVSVGVAYGCDVRQAAELLATCAREHRSILPVPAPEVLLHDFGNDALVLRLLYWTQLGGERGGPTVDSDLRFAIEHALREAGIAIAYPQRDVHLDLAGPVQIEVLEKAPAHAPSAPA